MKGRLTALILFVSILPGLRAQTPATEPQWEKDWDTAFARAKTEQKMVLVDFWASWCKPCLEMDREIFPEPEVARRLADFVLLKLNVDKFRGRALQERVAAYPSYGFYDPWLKRRFYFIGFHTAQDFSEKLDQIRFSLPLMIRAGGMLAQEESPEGYLVLGNAYLRAHDSADARDAYNTAKKRALKSGNPVLAQTASIQSAFALALEGKLDKALKLLEKERAKPVNSACETASLMAIGHIYRMKGDKRAATDAYRAALVTCGEDPVLRREAELALASMEP